ncbi:hypothetical protein U5801_08365 [Lamprobacter modestohalophilus]|uniref:hypothetical protein n=1 Tax=Lamprobacter modestohalophilus TaxID=1064514 RepID=UPI002ADEAEA0|nr:hypothetical protein [Lamprobacter modestohalophilus]MEA1049820.1 hypothetical protein [Lamprobacter modestohalophilus]
MTRIRASVVDHCSTQHPKHLSSRIPVKLIDAIGYPESGQRRRLSAASRVKPQAISVKAHPALLVFSLAFFVAPPVTSLGYALGDAPRRQTKILRDSVRALPAIA